LIRQRSDRLPQPPHGELDVRRLQMAPALYLGLMLILRVPLEIVLGEAPGQRPFRG
jgi:hypothetical protein